MDIQTRKIEFIQAFLKLESEEVISQFENLLIKKSASEIDEHQSAERMSIAELNERIDQSETDFKNGNYKNTSELLKKYN